MPEAKAVENQSTNLQDLHSAFLSSVPSDAQSHPAIQQMMALAATNDPAVLAQWQSLQAQYLASLNSQTPPAAATQGDALKQTGDIVQALLAERSFSAKNPATGQDETVAVPVKNVTVDAEMNGDKQSLVFRLHVDHNDTMYQAQIAEQAKQVLAELHPAFKPSDENAAPVRSGSYRDDTHISVIADVPAGKNPNEIVSDILEAKRLGEKIALAEADQAIRTAQAPVAEQPASDWSQRRPAQGTSALERAVVSKAAVGEPSVV